MQNGETNGHGQTGKETIMFPRDMTMSFSTEAFEVLNKWLIRKIVTTLVILESVARLSVEKEIRRDIKGP